MEEFKSIVFKYTRFKKSGKMYESDCVGFIKVPNNRLDSMYIVHEAIRELHKRKDHEMVWAIGMEDDWFELEELQQINFPVLIGM